MEDAATNSAAKEAAMTLDEFKQGMFRSLRDSGAMELVRVRSQWHAWHALVMRETAAV
jgi:hypothetical protein